jgi:hypothetical protein
MHNAQEQTKLQIKKIFTNWDTNIFFERHFIRKPHPNWTKERESPLQDTDRMFG